MQCVIVDDEPLAISLLGQFIAQTEGITLLQGFSDALESITFLNKTKIDILFLDIQMPDITGIKLLQQLQNKPPAVIFTTAYKDYAIESYELGVADYLLKPFSYDRFTRAVSRAEEFVKSRDAAGSHDNTAIFIKSEYKLIKLNLDDIVYAESLDDYIRIHLTEGKPIITLMSLKALQEKIPQQRFRRVHRKFIIALNKITVIEGKKICLDKNVEIPIGDTYQSAVQLLRSKL